MFDLFSVYLRREPTTDPVSRKLGAARKLDVVAYRDEACTKPAARWPWYLCSLPQRRKKNVIINCMPYKAVWLPNLTPSN